MMGLIIRGGAYIRNSLSISEYGGLIHGGGFLYLGGGVLFSEVYVLFKTRVGVFYQIYNARRSRAFYVR